MPRPTTACVNNGITDRGLAALADSPYTVNLLSLSLAVNRISSKSVPVLIRRGSLQGVTSMNLYQNGPFVWQTRAKLREHFGDCIWFEKPW